MPFLKKIRRAGLKLALIGLIAGLVLGLAIRIAENFIAKSVTELLNDEAQAACQCNFAADQVKISLLGLNGQLFNPRIEKNGQAKLSFERADASFSLSEISKKIITLADLHLQRGTALDVDEQSVTYQFIDRLTEPAPIEQANKSRLRLQLSGLRVSDSSFQQEYTASRIVANGIQLNLERDANADFVLKPFIAELNIELKDTTTNTIARTIKLGKINSLLVLTDTKAKFNKLRLKNKRNLVHIKAESLSKEGNLLAGLADYRLTTQLLQLSSFLEGELLGSGQLGGSLGQPMLQGNLKLAESSSLLFKLAEIPIFNLDSVDANFDYQLAKGIHKLNFNKLKSSNSDITVNQTAPISLIDDKISGRLDLSVGFLNFMGVDFYSGNFQVQLGNSLSDPSITVNGTARAQIGNLITPQLSFSYSGLNPQTIDISHNSQEYGQLKVNSIIKDTLNQNLEQQTSISLNSFKMHARNLDDEVTDVATTNSVALTGNFNLSDITSLAGLSGSGNLKVQSSYFANQAELNSKVNIKNGVIDLDIANTSKTLSATARVDLLDEDENSFIRITLDKFQPAEHSPASSCIQTSAKLDYKFSLKNYKTGKGNLRLEDFQLGCRPFTATLAQPAYDFNITNGDLQIRQFSLNSPTTNIEISGTAGLDQLNIKTAGHVNLNALLGFTPMLDDLRGDLKSELKLVGSIRSPNIDGYAKIHDVDLVSEELDLSAQDINGNLQIKGSVVNFEEFNGIVNNGSATITGQLDLFNWNKSSLGLKFEQIFIDSIPDTEMQISGDLTISESTNNIPLISGALNLDSVEILKELKAVNLVRDLLVKILPFSTSTSKGSDNKVANVELDVTVKGARNIVLISNFISAEFDADLRITGTAETPVVEGSLNVLSGWLGLKSQRFDITSGSLIFKPTYIMPEIDLLAETSVFSRSGSFIPIILEAKGSLNNPKILLSSETGHSSQELLTLLTSGGVRETESTSIQRLETFRGTDALSFFDKQPRQSFYYLLYRLTTIDDISIEPALNTRTGSIEPLFSVTKNLTDRLALVGESFLDTEGYSRLKARFDLAPRLSLVGLLDSSTTERNSALGVDLIYTILAKRKPFVEFDITNIKAFSRNELLQLLRVTSESRIRSSDLPALKATLNKLYIDQGYTNLDAILTCQELAGFCRNIKMQINEGSLNLARRRVLTGDPLPPEITIAPLTKFKRNTPATTELLKAEISNAVNRLRSEGYLSARVTGSYESLSDPNRYNLVLNIFTGNQQRFTFVGNTIYSSSEFLETINLFKRRQPFGRNTVNILVKNIERMYREAGYLHATVEYASTSSTDSRLTEHLITISEKSKTTIDSVNISGATELPITTIKNMIRKISPSAYEEVFNPSALITEQVKNNIKTLISVYRQAGFDTVSIKYEALPGKTDNAIILEYKINEGPRNIFSKTNIIDWPADIPIPDIVNQSTSIYQFNDLIRQLKITLNEAGFLKVQFTSNIDNTNHSLELVVRSGARTTITAIKVDGLQEISDNIVYQALQIAPNSEWDRQLLAAARARLLALGLFSKIELVPEDGKLDSADETLLVRLAERPLTTLEVGLGANSELGLHLFAEATDKSLLRDGRSLSLRIDGYFDQIESEISQGIASLRYSVPRLLDSNSRFTQDLRYQKLDLETLEFVLERSISDTSLHYNIDESTVGTFSYLLFEDSVSDVPDDAILSELDSGNVLLSTLGTSVRWDWRDNPVLPNQGYTLAIEPTLSTEHLGSDANYYSIGTRFSGLHPFYAGQFAFAHNTRAASAWTFLDTEQVPITQRYYIGGRQSIRGFRENSLGPKGENGSTQGGDLLLQNNLELRYYIGEAFATHLFFDAGSVFLKDQSFDTSEIRESAGIGFRYLSPIGPIGFDIGHPLDERAGEPSWRLHFNIGTQF